MSKEFRDKVGVKENKPNDWFETLYSKSNQEGEGIPWANMAPHPMFKNWITKNQINGNGKTALVVGCGMGDDAIELEAKGFEVTAFDVSHSAIELCKKRFPNSRVKFIQADLIAGISEWNRKFDFILEIFTIQAVPPKYENTLIKNISHFVANDGKLITIAGIQEGKRTFENGPPWLLNDEYSKSFEKCGLTKIFHFSNSKTESNKQIHLILFQRKLH